MTSGYVVFSASWFDSGYMLRPVYGSLRGLFPYSAQCLVLSGRRFLCRGAEADSNGLDCSADHSSSPVLLNTVIAVPVVQGVQVVEFTVVVQRPVPMVQTVCRTMEFTLLLDKVIDVPVVQVVQLPRWWSRRAVYCGAPQLQFSDKVFFFACCFVRQELGGAASAVLAVMSSL